MQASTCEIEVEQVKNWHSTHESKPGLVISPKEISRMMAEKLCDRKVMDSEYIRVNRNDPNKLKV